MNKKFLNKKTLVPVIVTAGIVILIYFFYSFYGSPASEDENVKIMENGLIAYEVKIGTGDEVRNGDTVSVNYTGAFTDGTRFDSSYDRGEPFSFTVGAGQVIQGWEKGILGMRPGGVRRLAIPPTLAYGAEGVPGAIPPNSMLIFEIELLEIKQ